MATFCLDPRGELMHSPRPLAAVNGPISKGKGGEWTKGRRREGKGGGQEGSGKGMGGEGREGERGK